MNKHLRNLLLISTVTISFSACAYQQGKDVESNMNPKSCTIMEHMQAAVTSTDNALAELREAAAQTTNKKKKQRLNKLIKEAEALAKNIGKCKSMCDVSAESGKSPAAMKMHRKSSSAEATDKK